MLPSNLARRFLKTFAVLAGLGSAALQAHAAVPCLLQTSYATTVGLIPSSLPNLMWTWDSTAPTTVRAAGCADITANLWSLPTANGNVTMALNPALQTNVALTSITSPAGIVGYPEVLYGYKPFGPAMTNHSAGMTFPVAVSKLPNLWLMTDYRTSVTDAALPTNLSYDLWITKSYEGTGVAVGDIELMIWLYRNDVQPAGSLQPQQTFTTPVWLNGVLQNGVFDVYTADPTLPNHTSELITFVLRGAASAGAASGGYSNGVVGFNLQPLVVRAERTLAAAYGWSTATMNAEYLNGIEFGTEFTPDNQEANFSWTLNHMCLVKPKTGTAPSQANAGSFVCP